MDVFLLPINIRNTRDAIIRTLAFFDLFNFPLTLDEISRYMLGLKIDRPHLKIYLNESKIIENYHGYYFLKGRQKLAERRNSNLILLDKLWKKVYRFLWIFKIMPFIKMAAVCNNLAFDNPRRGSDIDIFIATSKNRLFTARLIISGLLYIFGLKRHGKKIIGRFCLSFFTTENNLNLEKLCIKPYDIYMAYWIMSLAPVIGEETYYKFVSENSWTKRYFPAGIIPKTGYIRKRGIITKFIKYLFEKIFSGKFGDKIENFLAEILIRRAQKKAEKLADRSGTIISNEMLKFHDEDKRAYVREEWEERIKNY